MLILYIILIKVLINNKSLKLKLKKKFILNRLLFLKNQVLNLDFIKVLLRVILKLNN
jgi:hypothetical protein